MNSILINADETPRTRCQLRVAPVCFYPRPASRVIITASSAPTSFYTEFENQYLRYGNYYVIAVAVASEWVE